MLRTVVRRLVRAGWFTTTAGVTLALTVALAATVFAVVDGVLFKALPYPDADHLFMVSAFNQRLGRPGAQFSFADLETWKRFAGDLDLSLYISDFGLGPPAVDAVAQENTWAAQVDERFFGCLGQGPFIGGFQAADLQHPFVPGRPLAQHPAIISYRLWDRAFSRSERTLGSSLVVAQGTLQVVGILPRDFVFPARFGRTVPDVLLPLPSGQSDSSNRTRSLRALARIKPGVNPQTLVSSVNGPTRGGDTAAIALEPIAAVIGSAQRTAFRSTLFAVLIVLMLGTINVAALFSARLGEVRRDLAIRSALGASTGDLLALLLIEAAVLGALAGAAGAVVAQQLLGIVLHLLPVNWVLIKPPALDWRVLVFALAAGVTSSLCAAVPSGILALRSSVREILHSIRPPAHGHARRRALVLMLESALGLLVIVVGITTSLDFWRIWRAPAGLNRSNAALIGIRAASTVPPVRTPLLWADVLQAIRAQPGVKAAGMVGEPFLRNATAGSTVMPPPGRREERTEDVFVSSGFFEAAGIRLVAGRWLSDSELAAGSPVVVISESLVRAYWAREEPVGQVLRSEQGDLLVVGVVRDAHTVSLEDRDTSVIYRPFPASSLTRSRAIVLTVEGPPDELAGSAAASLRRKIPSVLVTRAESLNTALAGTARARQFDVVLFTSFAVAALVLFAAGLFGVVAVHVASRSRELALRMALGARRRQVRVAILIDALYPVVIGLSIGSLVAAWALQWFAASIGTIGTATQDLPSWILSWVLMIATTFAAAWVPSSRACAVDPVIILKDG